MCFNSIFSCCRTKEPYDVELRNFGLEEFSENQSDRDISFERSLKDKLAPGRLQMVQMNNRNTFFSCPLIDDKYLLFNVADPQKRIYTYTKGKLTFEPLGIRNTSNTVVLEYKETKQTPTEILYIDTSRVYLDNYYLALPYQPQIEGDSIAAVADEANRIHRKPLFAVNNDHGTLFLSLPPIKNPAMDLLRFFNSARQYIPINHEAISVHWRKPDDQAFIEYKPNNFEILIGNCEVTLIQTGRPTFALTFIYAHDFGGLMQVALNGFDAKELPIPFQSARIHEL